MPSVASHMSPMVIINTGSRPCRSPTWPKTTAPSGRVAKASQKMPNDRSICAAVDAFGKEGGADLRGKRAKE